MIYSSLVYAHHNMTSELIVLGLLMEKPLCGYKLKSIIEGKVSHYADISFSSIYFILDKLEENGMVQKKRVVQENRPAKNVYTITEKGRKEFLQLLNKKAMETPKVYDPFNIIISSLGYLDKKTIRAVLENRMHYNEKIIEGLSRCSKEKLSKWDRVLLDRGANILKSDLMWVNRTLKKV